MANRETQNGKSPLNFTCPVYFPCYGDQQIVHMLNPSGGPADQMVVFADKTKLKKFLSDSGVLRDWRQVDDPAAVLGIFELAKAVGVTRVLYDPPWGAGEVEAFILEELIEYGRKCAAQASDARDLTKGRHDT